MVAEVTYGSTAVGLKLFSDNSTSESTNSSSFEYAVKDQAPKPKCESAKSASGLVSKFSLSTRQASKICSSLADDSVNLPTPSETATWRRVIENGIIGTKAKSIEHILQNKHNFCLHFDGKRVGKKKDQVLQTQPEA